MKSRRGITYMNIDFTQDYLYLKGKKSCNSGSASGKPVSNLLTVTLAYQSHMIFSSK